MRSLHANTDARALEVEDAAPDRVITAGVGRSTSMRCSTASVTAFKICRPIDCSSGCAMAVKWHAICKLFPATAFEDNAAALT